MSNQNEKVVDAQTGETFTLLPEGRIDIVAAWISIAYSLTIIAYLGWLLLDMWTREPKDGFMKVFKEALDSNPVFKLVVFTAIGGAIGAAVNNIRSFVHWHAELRAFGWRFVWKYISLPPLGATLAVMVYAIIQGGIAMFTGSVKGEGPMASFSAWATGALTGYGSHKVFIWLDDKVNTLFKVESQTAKADVPDVSGKTSGEAEQTLKAAQLELGEVTDAVTDEPEKIGKVMSQTPVAGTKADVNTEVAITIGKASDGETSETAKVDVPDVSGKRRDEAEQTLKDGKLALGEVSEEVTSEEQKIGRVMSQAPVAGTKADANSKVALTIGKAS